MADGFYRLTYRDIADKLGISPDAARMKANRKAKAGHWRLLPDETPGQERLVEIPSAELDDLAAKAVRQAERSAPVEPAAPVAFAQPGHTTEHAVPAETAGAAEHSAPIEPYVPSKVSVSFDPQHPHLPPAAAERSGPGQPTAAPEHSASAEQDEQAVPTAALVVPVEAVPAEQPEQASQPEQAAQAEQTEDVAPVAPAPAHERAEQVLEAEQPTQAELVPGAEQVVEAEQAQAAEQLEGQPERDLDDDDLEVNAEGATGDALVSTLTARVAKLTNRLLEERSVREKASQELNASAVREAELKVEIERLSARVAELTDTVEHGHRPWWRRLFQGNSAD